MAAPGVFDDDEGQPGPYAQETWPVYLGATPLPATSPNVGPFWCVPVPDAWLPIVFGGLGSITQPGAWKVASEAALLDAMAWIDTLLGNMAAAQLCPEYGMVSVTIAAGADTGTAAVTFPVPFSVAPVVLVSGDSGVVICSAESITDTGFTARITANTILGASHTENVSWNASVAS